MLSVTWKHHSYEQVARPVRIWLLMKLESITILNSLSPAQRRDRKRQGGVLKVIGRDIQLHDLPLAGKPIGQSVDIYRKKTNIKQSNR